MKMISHPVDERIVGGQMDIPLLLNRRPPLPERPHPLGPNRVPNTPPTQAHPRSGLPEITKTLGRKLIPTLTFVANKRRHAIEKLSEGAV